MWCVRESATRLAMRIWERGAGETWGCGTGACAAAVAAILHGFSPEAEPITIASRGGELTIQWREGEPITLAPKTFDLLLALLERSGQLVDKDELLRTVWPDAFGWVLIVVLIGQWLLRFV